MLPPRLSGFGGKGIRTPDFQLAKLALYQLSYAPFVICKSLFCRELLSVKNFVRFALSQACDTAIVDTMSDPQKNTWEKISRSIGLYRYVPTGRYFARVRYCGKLYRKSLETDDSALAKRRLAEFRRTLEHTDAASGKKSFAAVL